MPPACKMSGIRVVGAGWERVSATARVVFIIYVCEQQVMALKYVRDGKIHVRKLPNNKNVERKTCLYARVSTAKQKPDLENQISMLKQFCFSNGFKVSCVYSDIASGISFEKRKDFFRLLDEVTAGRVEKVVITYKDRLSRVGFDLFYYLFQKYNCEIIVMSETGSQKLDSEEIFEEIIALLHCYSMKLYSRRKAKKIREILQEPEGEGEAVEQNMK